MSDAPDIDVTDDPAASRYVVSLDGEPAGFAAYRRSPGAVEFTHTVVEPAAEGHGVGSALIRAALDDARSRSERVTPTCEFVAAYVTSHPDYADLVA